MITNCDTGGRYTSSGSLAPSCCVLLCSSRCVGFYRKSTGAGWKGTDAQGVPLEEGTAFDVTVILAPGILRGP